uniref:UBC core domain-containing protein n=1 Tax=Leersia perrieri TaxID=77586 RepID=A0A0D9X7B3_9ORYZ
MATSVLFVSAIGYGLCSSNASTLHSPPSRVRSSPAPFSSVPSRGEFARHLRPSPPSRRELLSRCFRPRRKMLNLIKIKGQRKEDAASANGKPPAKKQSPGELRLHKDIAELNLPKSTRISFPNGKDDLMNFEVTIRPDEGYYVGGRFVFTFQVPPSYPHEPPKVKCKTKVYHPNIDLEGNVCLNILREDWKPVLNVNTIQPNDEDPLNHEAAEVLRDNPEKFARNVQKAMAGGYVGETHFPRCM